MSRQNGPGARGYLRIRRWEKPATGSTRRVLSNCWTDLVGWLRDWCVGVHETPGDKRIQGQFTGQAACASPGNGDILVTYISVFSPQANLHLDQPENRMKP